MSRPECWEQSVFLIINTPFRVVSTILNFPLTILWFLCRILVLPILLVLIIFSVAWGILKAVIMVFSSISKAAPALRPVSFVLALPALIIADFIVTVYPVVRPSDAEDKMMRWEFLEKFPYGDMM